MVGTSLEASRQVLVQTESSQACLPIFQCQTLLSNSILAWQLGHIYPAICLAGKLEQQGLYLHAWDSRHTFEFPAHPEQRSATTYCLQVFSLPLSVQWRCAGGCPRTAQVAPSTLPYGGGSQLALTVVTPASGDKFSDTSPSLQPVWGARDDPVSRASSLRHSQSITVCYKQNGGLRIWPTMER